MEKLGVKSQHSGSWGRGLGVQNQPGLHRKAPWIPWLTWVSKLLVLNTHLLSPQVTKHTLISNKKISKYQKNTVSITFYIFKAQIHIWKQPCHLWLFISFSQHTHEHSLNLSVNHIKSQLFKTTPYRDSSLVHRNQALECGSPSVNAPTSHPRT